MDKKNVLLLFGGNSFEHDISIITALTIYNKATACKFKLLPLYLSKNNEFYLFDGNKFDITIFKDFENSKNKNFKICYFKQGGFVYYKQRVFEKKIKVESIINCCHGGVGEDGTITAFFNQIDLPISSGSVLSHSISMNKLFSKYVFNKLNLPTIKFFKFNKQEFYNNRDLVLNKIKRLDFPVILKPVSLGSSIGIGVAKTLKEFIDCAFIALEFDSCVLVEKAIEDLREFNVACFKYKGEVLVSKIEEPKRTDEILSFKDKYIGDDGQELTKGGSKNTGVKSGAYVDPKISEVDLPEKIKLKIEEFATKIYNEFNYFGPVRMDFIFDEKGRLYINEVNSIPGSFAYYLFIPKCFKTMNNFIEAIVEESVLEYKKRKMIKREFITKLI